MSRIRDLAKILTASTDMATDAEVAASYAPLSNPTFTAIGGSEGGQINLAAAPSNTTLSGNINLDVYENRVRLFEGGGNNRGAYVDLTTLSNGVGSELIAAAPQSGNTGKHLVTNGTTASWQELNVAGKNAIINGGFDIWQRGTSITVNAATKTYTADRWWAFQHGGTATVSRQTSDLTAFQYGLRYQRNSGQTATNALFIQSPVETANAIPYAGKQVTFSFYAKRGANYSASSNLMNVVFQAGTGTDQDGYGGYTGNIGYVDTAVTLTTTYQRFSYTFTIGSTITEFQPVFYYTPTGTAGANDWFEITGVQVEVGGIATQFTRSGGTLAGELAACQRYYQVLGDNIYELIYGGYMTSGTTGYISFPFPVTMRTTPTGTLVGGWAVFNTGQPIIQSTHPKTISLRVVSTVTGQFYFHSNTTYYLTMNAEL